MNIEEAFQKRVQDLCQERNLSYEDIIKIRSSVQDNTADTTIDSVEQICLAMNISIADFFCSDTFRNLI